MAISTEIQASGSSLNIMFGDPVLDHAIRTDVIGDGIASQDIILAAAVSIEGCSHPDDVIERITSETYNAAYLGDAYALRIIELVGLEAAEDYADVAYLADLAASFEQAERSAELQAFDRRDLCVEEEFPDC